MKNNRLIITLIALFLLGFGLNAQTTPTEETAAQKEKRMEWFSQAKLGIFIHWGIYAVNGVSESWSFFNNYLPYEEYMAQEKGFTASAYNPQEWVKLIKESGARYTVITTKHHDGVALWDTKVGDLSTVKSTPAGRDLIAPFVKEVRKQGLKLDFTIRCLTGRIPIILIKLARKYVTKTIRIVGLSLLTSISDSFLN